MAAGDPYFNCDNSRFSMAQVLRKMISEDGNGKPVFNLSSTPTPTPIPYGDIFVEDFNPQVGTYVDSGTFSKVITTGNMAVSGGNGFFYNNSILQDVVWNGNNWYFESEYVITTSAINDWGVMFGLQSITGGQPQNIYFGLYYFNANNSTAISLFGSNPALGQIAPESTSLNATAGDRLKVRAEFVENIMTITATNVTNPNTVSLTYTFSYSLSVSSNEVKPNTGKIIIIPSSTTTNIKFYKFGSPYAANVNRMFIGDSITSGYFGNAEANKFQNLYSVATGNSIATMAGAGDRSIELANATALSKYTLFSPTKVHILIGTNDVANGVSLATIQANINSIISAFQAVGSQIFIGTILPRNGQNNLPLNAFINGLSGVTVIDYYTAMEDTTPGDINPAYSDEDIHPNAAGMIFMKNLLIASGF